MSKKPQRATPMKPRDWWTPPPVYRKEFTHLRPPGAGRPPRRSRKVHLHPAAGDRTAREILDRVLEVLGVSRGAFETPGRVAATREARGAAYAILRALGLSWPAIAECCVAGRNHSSVIAAVMSWSVVHSSREKTRRVCRAVGLGTDFDAALDLVRSRCQRMKPRSGWERPAAE